MALILTFLVFRKPGETGNCTSPVVFVLCVLYCIVLQPLSIINIRSFVKRYKSCLVNFRLLLSTALAPAKPSVTPVADPTTLQRRKLSVLAAPGQEVGKLDGADAGSLGTRVPCLYLTATFLACLFSWGVCFHILLLPFYLSH
jgi:hypothetical protein